MTQSIAARLLFRLFVVVTIISTIIPAPFYQAASVARANQNTTLSPDSDSDGLLDEVEANWCNTVDCFTTDPLDSDSDDDGLTDGQEKLFESDPTDGRSPGLYTLYGDSFETEEYYFAWTPEKRTGDYRPFGHKMLSSDRLVVRRGSTFTVGSPAMVGDHTVTLQVGDGLELENVILPDASSPLDPLIISTRNDCGDKCNSWDITVPADGTVGEYELIASNGNGWSKELTVYVIFEMPSGLTDAQVDAYLYDGNRNLLKDETAIWFYGDRNENTQIRFAASDFILDQYEPYIFDGDVAVDYTWGDPEDYPSAIEAVHGTDSTWDASDRLAERADEVTCFAYPLKPRTKSWRVLFPNVDDPEYGANNQCSNIAGLVTAFHRAVGIPSRLVVTDHRNSNFDTSSEVWTRPVGTNDPYTWYTTRSFINGENGPRANNICTTTHKTGGYRARVSRAEYGSTHYRPVSDLWPTKSSANNGNEFLIFTTNEKLEWENGQDVPPQLEGGDRDYFWVTFDKYNISRYEWVETAIVPYWGEHYDVEKEPVDAADPPTPAPAWDDDPPEDYAPPAAPSLDDISNGDGDGDYTVSWSAEAYATSYILQVDDNGSFSTPLNVFKDGDIQYNKTGQVNGTWYYRVQAESEHGVLSDWSNIKSVTVTSGGSNSDEEVIDDGGGGTGPEGASLLSSSSADVEKVRLGEILGEHTVDEDGDGQFDYLILDASVDVAQPGSYWVLAQIGLDHPDLAPSGYAMAADTFQIDLVEGEQVINLVFDGGAIARNRLDGPYSLVYFLITDVENPGPVEFANEALDYQNDSYTTAAYKFNDFDTPDAMFARQYTERGIDSNQDGFLEALEIDVALDIYQPGTYTVVGDLYDGQRNQLGQATWSGTDVQATLHFDDLGKAVGPYKLQDLRLSDANGNTLDSLAEAYTTQQAYSPQPLTGFTATAPTDGLSALGIGSAFSDAGVDTDGDGKYDQLQLNASVDITESGDYNLEGWLVDEEGNLVSWAKTGPVTLSSGDHQLSLNYDGRALYDYMKTHNKSAQTFTLTALKLYTGQLDWDNMEDEVDVAHTTANYNIDQFEPATSGTILFEDNMENGDGKWAGGYQPWTIANDGNYFNGSHAWHAANTNASLQIDLSNAIAHVLKFRTYHQLGGSSDTGYVKASTDGTTWQTIATFSENVDSWETKIIDLSSVATTSSLYLRFELASEGGDANDNWYIDDILIVGVTDTDGDGIPDDEEEGGDSDGDGIPDDEEEGVADTDGDGIPDNIEGTDDYDGDGLPNNQDPDSDDDGIPDNIEGTDDNDLDGKPDYLDVDSDDDTIPDKNEWSDSGNHPFCTNNSVDSDGDTVPDCQDNDVDGDGIDNYVDIDSDGDGIDDAQEVGKDPNNPPDTDGDNIPDYYDSVDNTEDNETDENSTTQTVYLPLVVK